MILRPELRPQDAQPLEHLPLDAVQRKALAESVVRAVTVEGPAQARLKLDRPIRQVGAFDRVGSKWHLGWWPQRDETPNGIPAEFVIKL